MMSQERFNQHLDTLRENIWNRIKQNPDISFEYEAESEDTCCEGCKLKIVLKVIRTE